MSTTLDPINAFTQLIPSSPLKTQNVFLLGYNFAVKDVFDVKGFRTQAGNPDYFAQASISETTALAVAILQEAGAHLIAKTQTDELGGSLFGLNEHYGAPLNSHSPDRVPGGSSSGSAAAVAANLVDFALGADTSGSVRAPASFCGIYGLRPTLGQISTTGVLPISSHLDTVGIFSRQPDVIAQVLNVYGIKEQNEIKRLKIIPSLVGHLQDSLLKAFREKLEDIQQLTSSSVDLLIEEETLVHWSSVIRTIAMYDLWQVHKDWVLESNPIFGEIINDRLKLARSISFEDYRKALLQQKEIRSFMEDHLESGDVAVFPTVHDIPPFLSSSLTHLKEFALKASRHTCIAALSGFPELTVPLHNRYGNGALGMSFLGRIGEDVSLATFASKACSFAKTAS
ncbi:MAG: amidase [Alphaproteobacteria bacterium]|nr:amidase [Alphaproteobacteria bacterium]MDI9635776.1 amidase family protein [Geitlerinema splendidum]